MEKIRKIYIGAPFRSASDIPKEKASCDRIYGKIWDSNYVARLERIEKVLKRYSPHVCLPHRDEGKWGEVYIPPKRIGGICLAHVKSSDLVVALSEESRGVCIELGYAAALRKKIIVCLKDDERESTLLQGLSNQTQTMFIRYENEDDLVYQLKECITEMVSGEASPRYAVIDLGSNTIKLYVGKGGENGFWKMLKFDSLSSRLSEGFYPDLNLKKEAIERNVELIKKYKKWIGEYNVVNTLLVSTGAARKAKNKDELISAIGKKTGFKLNILSEKNEAEILYKGVMHSFPDGRHTFVVLNIGGNSTELAIGTQEEVSKVYNFPFGTVDLRSKLIKSDPVSTSDHRQLMAYIKNSLDAVKLQRLPDALFIHTGGELDYVISAGCRLQSFSLSPAHPYKISLADFKAFAGKTRGMDKNSLYKLAPNSKNPRWMDGAVVCNAIAIALMERLDIKEIIPSNVNLAHGLLLQLVSSA